MIRAGDRAAKPDRFLDKDHAAVTADILEYVDVDGRVAKHQHRNAEKIHWFGHARGGDVLAETDRRPAVAEHPVLFVAEHSGIDIAVVRKAVRRFDRRHHIAQVGHDGYPFQESIAADRGIDFRQAQQR